MLMASAVQVCDARDDATHPAADLPQKSLHGQPVIKTGEYRIAIQLLPALACHLPIVAKHPYTFAFF
jgi:hypothetical protein